ncbi:cell division transport system permease protein [Catenuloplanes nepalensis]|uniref:Cell division protein FtsX n=1 Tax=Catenuloplanes nepalensis TaxID=587533 RepID=A0ABT9N787_9ACTN|nr:permease-like cell division protein FtsX [Catenuloplanes nepalensis]MDP9799562.1 cell division transport system permease protein [Catenuloplanes nepalensis]
MRLKYVLSEVLVGLWRNVTMTIAMIITMSVSLTMLGASALLYLQANEMKDFYYANIEVAMFLKADVNDEQRQSLDAQLSSDGLVQSYELETKEKALEKFQTLWRDTPDLVKSVSAEQLPESFRVKLNNPEQYEDFATKYASAEGVDEILDQRALLEKVFGILNSVQTMSLVASSIMAIAALLLVGNTIQVAAYSKRREVAVMKLVGASNWFIQAPFVLEAVAAGVLGALLGFGALVLGKILLIDGALRDLTELLTPLNWDNVLLMLPFMAGAGAVVSAVTAWTTLRFYLRV